MKLSKTSHGIFCKVKFDCAFANTRYSQNKLFPPINFMGRFVSQNPTIHQKALSLYFSSGLSDTKAVPATGSRNIHGWVVENPNDAPVYLHFYDALTANVTVGSTTPTFSVPVPAGGYADKLSDVPLKRFANGIVVAITTSKTGAAGAPSVACLTHVHYK